MEIEKLAEWSDQIERLEKRSEERADQESQDTERPQHYYSVSEALESPRWSSEEVWAEDRGDYGNAQRAYGAALTGFVRTLLNDGHIKEGDVLTRDEAQEIYSQNYNESLPEEGYQAMVEFELLYEIKKQDSPIDILDNSEVKA